MSAQPQPQRAQAPQQQERREERIPDRLVRPSMFDRDSRFELDHGRVPRDMVMEWKRVSLFGMRDKRNEIICHRYHWRPVTHEMQPHLLGHLEHNPKANIVIDGLQLMMRPKYLNDEAQREHENETNYLVNQQLQSLRGSSKSQVGDRNTTIKREFVAPAPQQVVE